MELRKDLVLRNIGSEHVIVDPGQDIVDMSTVFTLNESAVWIWTELQKMDQFTLGTIAEILMERYEVSLNQAEKDAEKLLDLFREHNLLQN